MVSARFPQPFTGDLTPPRTDSLGPTERSYITVHFDDVSV